jgi:cullin 1
MVLTYNSWPFSASHNLVLPIELKQTIDSFTNFYSHQHSGRKLMWLYQHSKGELHTSFTKKKYILQVSTYQMNVLLLFNKQTNWIVEKIQDETQIQQEILLQILYSLLKIKLLICDEINVNEDYKESDIQLNYHIKLADQFNL